MLKPETVYLADNGRLVCSDVACAGMTAAATGRDLSGQALLEITPDIAATETFLRSATCECAKRVPCLRVA